MGSVYDEESAYDPDEGNAYDKEISLAWESVA
jgi:hypothetical protein